MAESLVGSITTAGTDELPQAEMKRLKDLCRSIFFPRTICFSAFDLISARTSSEATLQCFDALLSQLRKNHSQIRLAAMQVTHELFMRSSVFRARAVDCLRELVELGVGSADEDLPPPKRFAKMLLKYTVRCVCAWEQAHGKKYLQLTAAISHIAHLHNVSCSCCSLLFNLHTAKRNLSLTPTQGRAGRN